MRPTLLFVSMALAAADPVFSQETVRFPSLDGLTVTADLYMAMPKSAPFILLFHQADYSRGEYVSIAPRLNALGYNAMAVDLRSGNAVRGVRNETAAAARGKSLKTNYLDALPDMRAAVSFARSSGLAQGSLILWGSSYSASLVLKMAGDDPAICDAVLSFSPGEYFPGTSFVSSSAAKIKVPVFVTSGPGEGSAWSAIYAAIGEGAKSSFLPEQQGSHGSQALWPSTSGSSAYWKHVEDFLRSLKK